MSTPKDMDNRVEKDTKEYKLKDAADNKGIVPEDALQKVNPAAAARATDDHDPHNVVQDHKQFDSPLMEDDK